MDSHNIESLPKLADFMVSLGWDKELPIFLMNVHEPGCQRYCHAISSRHLMRKFIQMILNNPSLYVFRETFNLPHYLERAFVKRERYRPRFWGCGANTSLFIYDPHGCIFPCYESVGDQRHVIGWYMPRFKLNKQTYALWRGRTVFAIPQCEKCNLAFFCGGGCSIMAFTKTGSIMQPECDMMRGIAEYIVPFLFNTMKDKLLRNEG